MSKALQFNEEALQSILRGMNAVVKAVAITLGPNGRCVLIKRPGGKILSTKEGSVVAEEIVLPDRFENIGAQFLREAALQTARTVGDGTSLTIILTQALYAEGVKSVMKGSSPFSLKKGMDTAVEMVCKTLDELATPVEKIAMLKSIASVAASNDSDIGNWVAQALEQVGKDGMVTTNRWEGVDIHLDILEGIRWEGGYLSPYFVTDPETMTAELDHPLILIADQKISSAEELIPLLEQVANGGKRPLLIIADQLDSEALTTLVTNKIKGDFPICAVGTPTPGKDRKERLKDLAILTGGSVVCPELGSDIKNIQLSMLGQAKKARVGPKNTLLTGGAGYPKEIQKRAQEIKNLLKRSSTKEEQEQVRHRRLTFGTGVAILHIGAPTEEETKEKQRKVEKALHATYTAVAEGVVPGGGVSLLRASSSLDSLVLEGDLQIGVEIVRKALQAPAATIATNCGKLADVIVEKIVDRQGSWGYNGITDEFADLMKDGILDPVLLLKTALKNGASVASTLLTIAVAIAEQPSPKSPHPSVEG